MISWVLSQQLTLSLVLLAILACVRFATPLLGPRVVYSLWLLVPIILLANQLPTDLVTPTDSPTYRYVVNYEAGSDQIGQRLHWQLLWWLGAAAVLVFFAYQQWQVERVQGAPLSGALRQQLPDALRVELCEGIRSPILVGLVHPRLLLPHDFEHAFSVQQQRLILAHELVHWRRHDAFANAAALLLLTVFWFNPIAWLGYRTFRFSQEQACDAVVLQNADSNTRLQYSRAMVASIARQQTAHSRSTCFSLSPHYGDKHSMVKRIQSIQNGLKSQAKWVLVASVLASGMVGTVVMAKQKPLTEMANLAQPVMRIEPRYPKAAAEQGIEGSVVLAFDIDANGSTSNIKVVEAKPEQLFDQSAIDALSQWTYKPRVVGGKAEKQTGLVVQLDYVLSVPGHEQIIIPRDKS